MGSQIIGVLSQYIVLGAILIGLLYILRNPGAVTSILNSLSNLNVGAINAWKK